MNSALIFLFARAIILLLIGHSKRKAHILTPEDFEQKEEAAKPCLLKPEARKRFVQHFETKMQSGITHPHTGYRVDYRRCLDLQITELAQVIRGDREDYRPMKVRL